MTDPRGTVTTYTHNQYNDNLTKVAVSESDVDYTYNYGVVRTITHNTDDTAANDVKYTFEYDEFGNSRFDYGNGTKINLSPPIL